MKTIIKKIKRSKFVLTLFNYLYPKNWNFVGKTNFFQRTNGIVFGIDIKIHGNNNQIIIGKGSIISNCKINIIGNNCKIIIGENCRLENTMFWIEDDFGVVTIGNKTGIKNTGFTVIEETSITIGEDCMIPNVVFRTSDSHSIIDLNGNRINPAKSIIIGNHVWFGIDVLCMKGTNIPDNVIIGARTVLTGKYYECGTILVGSPPKILKRDIDWIWERI